jgi:hypothetical protein
MNQVPLENKQCSSCADRNSQICYYTLLPFQEHLAEIFSGMYIPNIIRSPIEMIVIPIENWDKVQYPFRRHVDPDVLQDIQDGKRYKKQSKFFCVPEHAGLILCTDGVPLFKSSGRYHIHTNFKAQADSLS